MILESVITCPHCATAKSETMPIDACGAMLRPKPGDCCVFCSYGSVPCPPIQAERSGGTGGSHAVRSPGCYFLVGENRRHSRGLVWGAPVSGRQFPVLRLLRGGFRAPVSAVGFSISVRFDICPPPYLVFSPCFSAFRLLIWSVRA
jgi:hypothetical protein